MTMLQAISKNSADKFNVLIVEDDSVLGNQLCEFLTAEGFFVDVCVDGGSGFKAAASGRYQLILLDIMLPQLDGVELLSQLRQHSQVPVIILSAKGAEEERILGLRKGADDYVSKPYSSQELLLRIEALLRRCHSQAERLPLSIYRLDRLHIDTVKGSAEVDSTELDLTPIEFKLLKTLIVSVGEVLSKAFLYQSVLNRPYSTYDRSLDMHFSRMRRKLYNAGWDGARLQTVHGKGYILS